MTNDPSMTITSTIPAPEVGDSTSREGKTIPLPVTEGGNAPPAPDVPPPSMVQKIGNGGFEITNFKPPFSFEKIEYGGRIKVAHF